MLFLIALLDCGPMGCGNEPATPVSTRVLLLGTEFLEDPAVKTSGKLLRPTLRASVADDLAVFAFRLTVDAGTNDLILQATLRHPSDKRRLTRIELPDNVDPEFSQRVEQLSVAQEELLRDGTGFFWLESQPQDHHHLVSVVLPALPDNGYRSLRISTRAINEFPVTGLEIALADDFFYMVVLGDSVQWGNGLTEAEKMSEMVIQTIEAEVGTRVVLQRYAHSGATIYPRLGDGVCEFNCYGEVPKFNTSILAQVDQVIRPDLVDFVLADGCINDVNVANIVNPSQTPETIAQMAEPPCRDGMTQLLQKIHATMPSAAIVITGYYQIVGPESDVVGLNAWLESQGQPPSELEESLVPVLTENSIAFLEIAHTALRGAIEVVRTESADLQIGFADPGFEARNAVFAPEAWLWGMTADNDLLETLGIELDLAPTDDSRNHRIDRCLETNLDIGQLIICLYASVGHPTPAGSEAYAAAIVQQLREFGILRESSAESP